MTTWDPKEGDSPDRVDALVWGITALMTGGSAEVIDNPLAAW
jgi:phage terminase large subunit-like protein